MNHRLVFFILLLTCFIYTASNAMKPTFRSYVNPNKCFLEKKNMELDVGKKYQVPGMCASMVCDSSYDIQITGCVLEPMTINCTYISGNKELPHPQCCPSVQCTEFEITEPLTA